MRHLFKALNMTHLFDMKCSYWQWPTNFCSNLATFIDPVFKILKFDTGLLYNKQIKKNHTAQKDHYF